MSAVEELRARRARLLADLETATNTAVEARDREHAKPMGKGARPDADGVLAALAHVAHYNRQKGKKGKPRPATCPLPTTKTLAAWLLGDAPAALPLAAAVAEAALLTPADAERRPTPTQAEFARLLWANRAGERWLTDFAPVLPGNHKPSADLSFAVLFLADLVLATLAAGRPRAPLFELIDAWESRPDTPGRVHVLTTRERKPPKKAEPLMLARTPGLLALMQVPLEAVQVDGELLVSATPDARRRYCVLRPAQGELFPAPRKLDGRATGGALVEAVASVPLGGDERSPLRADLHRVGTFAYALTRPVQLTPGETSLLIVGRDTPEGREQALRLVWVMRSLSIAPAGKPWAAFDAEPGAVHRIGPPRWWLDEIGPRAYRLTGALFRRLPGTGRKAARWGTSERTIAGIEGALLWGPSAGKGRDGRRPDAVRPVTRGGPGAPVLIPWHHVLRLGGEHVTPEMLADKTTADTLNKRYNRRIDVLVDAGYEVGARGEPAPAGDTIEIVRRIKGGRHHEAALEVRATARFCAAYARGGERTEIPASHLLLP